MSQKKILVTGVAGFLGSHLAENLANMGHEVIGIDNLIGGYEDNIPKNIKFLKIDCCDLSQVQNVMKNINVNKVNSGTKLMHRLTILLVTELSVHY